MRILEAAQLVSLREEAFTRHEVSQETRTAAELADDVFSEAEDRDQPFVYQTREGWTRRWLPSRTFRLLRLPLNAAALPCEPKGQNLVLKKIHAQEDKPIVVDFNRNGVGSSMNGFTPKVIVIDGKHRFKAAALRGDTHIMAWVGELAVQTIHGVGGGGGGPAPERTTPAPGSSLVAKKIKARGSEQEAKIATRMGTTYSAEGAHMKEMNVDKLAAEYEAACKAGYKPRGRRSNEIHAVHPPGCEEQTRALKKKYGDTDKTYKIAWYLKNKGGCG